jgi:ABC-type antimicrobial peptide transport system ATPase subunit
MDQGLVVEEGDTDMLIRAPQHAVTRNLVTATY